MNRETKRRASQSERASATDPQRALRACARDPRRRSRPLRVVIACASVVVMLMMAIVPTFASSANGNQDGENVPEFESMMGVNGIQISSGTSKWNFDYNQKVVGYDPQTFASNQKTESVIYGPSTVLQKTIQFLDKTPTQTFWGYESDDYIDGAEKTRVLPTPSFTAYKKGGEIQGQYNCIIITMRAHTGMQWAYIKTIQWGLYYGENDYQARYTAYTNYTGGDPDWQTAWHRKLDLNSRYNDLVWGNSIEGLSNYKWLLSNAKLYTSGPSDAVDYNSKYDYNPFCRIMRMSLEAEHITDQIVRATTNYTIKRWWQTGNQEAETNIMYITLQGKNVVRTTDDYDKTPYIHEFPDNWRGAPKYRTTATYSYYYIIEDANNSYSDGFKEYVQVTKEYDSGWKSTAGKDFNLYPSWNDLFPNAQLTDENGNPIGKINVYALVINEFKTEIALPEYSNNEEWHLRITDYYYRGEERQKRLVMNWVNEHDSEFMPNSNWSQLGTFLSNSVGSFFNTKLFGTFSITDIMLVVIGIGLVIAFLKFFAGG